MHSTDNLDDGYLGSGIYLKRALQKYNKDNFRREIIRFFDSVEEAILYEKQLVTENFSNRTDTYNIANGGCGGNLGNGWYNRFIEGNDQADRNNQYENSLPTRIKNDTVNGSPNMLKKMQLGRERNGTTQSAKSVVEKQLATKKKNNSFTFGKRNGMYGKKSPNYVEYDHAIHPKLIEYNKLGITDRELPLIFNLSRNKIKRILKKLGVKSRTTWETIRLRDKNKHLIDEILKSHIKEGKMNKDGTGPDGKGQKKVNPGTPSRDGRGQGKGRGRGRGQGGGRRNN